MPRCDAAPIQLGQTGYQPRPPDIASGRRGTGAKGHDLIAAPTEASTSPILTRRRHCWTNWAEPPAFFLSHRFIETTARSFAWYLRHRNRSLRSRTSATGSARPSAAPSCARSRNSRELAIPHDSPQRERRSPRSRHPILSGHLGLVTPGQWGYAASVCVHGFGPDLRSNTVG